MAEELRTRKRHVAPTAVRILGWLGYLGIVAFIAGDIIGSVYRHGYNPIAQTVSLLGRHRFNLPQDIGLYLLALGTLASGVGLHFVLRRGWKRTAIVVALVVEGVVIGALTAFDLVVHHLPYADAFHLAFSGVAFFILLTLPYFFAFTVKDTARGYALWSITIGIAYTVLLACYFFIPHGWFGLYERGLIFLGLLWLGMVGWSLVKGGGSLTSA